MLVAWQEPDASSFPNGGIRIHSQQEVYSRLDSDIICICDWNDIVHSFRFYFLKHKGNFGLSKTPLLAALQLVDEAATDGEYEYETLLNSITEADEIIADGFSDPEMTEIGKKEEKDECHQ
ncbi:hypothetical protein FQA39_LY19181 [Lamprigera yunnana]|nr:hypothetical protein FQA39_LY19181 [Lamprigera yunnana]